MQTIKYVENLHARDYFNDFPEQSSVSVSCSTRQMFFFDITKICGWDVFNYSSTKSHKIWGTGGSLCETIHLSLTVNDHSLDKTVPSGGCKCDEQKTVWKTTVKKELFHGGHHEQNDLCNGGHFPCVQQVSKVQFPGQTYVASFGE